MSANLAGPASHFAAVTPHNSTNLAVPTRALYVGTTGNVTAVSESGEVVLFKAVPAGAILPVVVIRVNATGTTATDIVALF